MPKETPETNTHPVTRDVALDLKESQTRLHSNAQRKSLADLITPAEEASFEQSFADTFSRARSNAEQFRRPKATGNRVQSKRPNQAGLQEFAVAKKA